MEAVQVNVDKYLQRRKRIPTKKVLEARGVTSTLVLSDDVPMCIERIITPYEAFKIGVEIVRYVR